MTFDSKAASNFMAGHARMLDRRRFETLFEDGEPGAVLSALSPYRNPDGGFGWGLEPDLRSPESQPAGALHAFEAIADAGLADPRATELCDWLASVTLDDGGLPFALPVTVPAATAPFWAGADHTSSSLQITAYVAAQAHRVAAFDPDVGRHPWLARATDYCRAAIDAIDDAPFALVLNASLQFADASYDLERLERLAAHLPPDGLLPVTGGLADEVVRPLEIAPTAGRPLRDLFAANVIERELERLAGEQQDDGGWRVDFRSYSPAAELEWRGYATVRAVETLLGGAG